MPVASRRDLDELSNATWQPVPPGFPCSGCTVQHGDRAVWNIHNPTQAGDDPQEAKGWFSRFDRPTNEIKEIASVSGNTVTFTSPLSIAYRVSHNAQLTGYNRHVAYAGVENLTLKGGSDGELVLRMPLTHGRKMSRSRNGWAKA